MNITISSGKDIIKLNNRSVIDGYVISNIHRQLNRNIIQLKKIEKEISAERRKKKSIGEKIKSSQTHNPLNMLTFEVSDKYLKLLMKSDISIAELNKQKQKLMKSQNKLKFLKKTIQRINTFKFKPENV